MHESMKSKRKKSKERKKDLDWLFGEHVERRFKNDARVEDFVLESNGNFQFSFRDFRYSVRLYSSEYRATLKIIEIPEGISFSDVSSYIKENILTDRIYEKGRPLERLAENLGHYRMNLERCDDVNALSCRIKRMPRARRELFRGIRCYLISPALAITQELKPREETD